MFSGSTGPVGPPGPAGQTGFTGSSGATGAQGTQGPVGPKGAKGYSGYSGQGGVQGNTGSTGQSGYAAVLDKLVTQVNLQTYLTSGWTTKFFAYGIHDSMEWPLSGLQLELRLLANFNNFSVTSVN
jgi:hypothetical protein